MALGNHPMVDPSRQSMQPRADIPRSAFDVRDFHKTTFGQGALTPVYLQEVLPGDSIRVKMSALVRLAPALVPVMDNLDLHSWFFFVPYRLLWDHWEQFIAGPQGPADTTVYLLPGITFTNAALGPGSLGDYMGLTVNNSVNTIAPSALPFRAYALIYKEWFRDQAIDTAFITPSTGDGPDVAATYPLYLVRKKHDYFTSARPWPQASLNVQESGNLGPLLPGGRMTLGLTGQGVGAPVTGLSIVSQAGTVSNVSRAESGARTVEYAEHADQATHQFSMRMQTGASFPDVRVLVNDLRTAVMIQNIAERTARVGGRYSEYLRGVFGVHPPDSRLQRPEYLGGGRTMVTVNPVAQTSATEAGGTPLGQPAGSLYAAATDHGFSGSFQEHGIILGLMATRSELTYQQGVERFWWRRSTFDFYRPELANLGEQAIESHEIYCDGAGSKAAGTDDYSVFGYQERWAEYRTRLSRTSGYQRSTVTTPIDMWHFGEEFTGRPTLNPGFLAESAPVDRVLVVTADYYAQYVADIMFESRMVRPLPMFSVPGVGARL